MAVYKRSPLKNLIINPANDRHGELGSEDKAIEWLLVNKTEKMKDLLNDVVSRNGIVEEPLVMKSADSDQYIVYDGNRRVTCLKLLCGLTPENIDNPLAKKSPISEKTTKKILFLSLSVELKMILLQLMIFLN